MIHPVLAIPSRDPDLSFKTSYNSLVSFWWKEGIQTFTHNFTGNSAINIFMISYENNNLYFIDAEHPGSSIEYTSLSWWPKAKDTVMSSYAKFLLEKEFFGDPET